MSELAYSPAFRLGTSYALRFTPDESGLLVVGARVQLWDVAKGKRLHSVAWSHGSDADVSDDGELVVVSNTSGDLLALDARTFEQRWVVRGRDVGEGPGPRFANGGQIVQCSWGGHVVVRWARDGEIVWREREEGHMITELASTRDRSWFAYAGHAGGTDAVWLRRWAFDRYPAEELTRVDGSIEGLAFSPDGTRLVVQSTIGLEVWDVMTRSRVAERAIDELTLDGVAWGPDGELAAAQGVASVVAYSDALEPRWSTPLPSPTAVAYSPSGNVLALGSGDQGLVLRRSLGAAPALEAVPDEDPVSVEPRDPAEEQVISYVEIEAGEGVVGLEKVAGELVGAERYDVWDVETESGRWWAIGGNLLGAYDQAQHESSDVALSFHVGVSARLREDDRRGEAWRHWERAVDAYADAHSAEEARAVGASLSEAIAALDASRQGPLAAYVATLDGELARATAWLAAAEDARPDECKILLDGVRHLLESVARLR